MSDAFAELVGPYVLGALDDEDVVRLTTHMAGCTSCTQLEADLRGVVDRLDTALPPADLWTRIEAEIERNGEGEAGPSR